MRVLPAFAASLVLAVFSFPALAVDNFCRYTFSAAGLPPQVFEENGDCSESSAETICGGYALAWDAAGPNSGYTTSISGCDVYSPITSTGGISAVGVTRFQTGAVTSVYYINVKAERIDRDSMMSVLGAGSLLIGAWIAGYLIALSVSWWRRFVESAAS